MPYGDFDAVAAAMHANVAAILIEPIQGEGGIIVPPDGYLKHLRRLCDEHRSLLVLDEIQSGLGRTGKLFAYEHEGIRPDVVILGKALSGGLYPVSAILADDAVMDVFHPGDHGSTYGGNPVAAAVATTALEVLVDEKLIERSAELGADAIDRLRRLRLALRQGAARPRPVDRRRAAPRGRRRPAFLRGAPARAACCARKPTTT